MQRIGVFVCHCGTNIAATVDVKKVVEMAAKEPGLRVPVRKKSVWFPYGLPVLLPHSAHVLPLLSFFRAFFLFLSVLCFLIWLFVSSDFFYSSWLVGMKTTTKVNENHQFCYFFAQIFVALRFLENDERAP